MEENLKPEVMAPAGSFESLAAAINAGCDSIYFGVNQLNMRARSSHNFTIEELKQVAETCKAAKVRSYITLNTLLYEHDMALMKKIISAAKESGINAVIVQDMSAIQYAQSIGMPIQASTQLSISNFESVKFYAQFADTVVLAREVDLMMMKIICDKIKENDVRGPSGELVKIEVFVHGALCIAQSGRCQMSLLSSNTSAQRGACLHECRKTYIVKEEETGQEMKIRDGFILSPKDLCALPFLDQLIDSGVSVLKIEGRGRSPQYVDTVIKVYREAVDAIAAGEYTTEKIDAWMERLGEVYNRGFSDGYYLGKTLPEWSGYSGNRAKTQRAFVGLVNHYFPKAGMAEVKTQAHDLAKGDRIVIMGKTTGVVKGEVTSMKREEEFIEKSTHPDVITFPVAEKVRPGDKVYILKKRSLDVIA
jgi:U32 family peptidase